MESSQLFLRKRKLEEELHRLIAQFEVDTDLVVDDVKIVHEQRAGYGKCSICVEVAAQVTAPRGPKQ